MDGWKTILGFLLGHKAYFQGRTVVSFRDGIYRIHVKNPGSPLPTIFYKLMPKNTPWLFRRVKNRHPKGSSLFHQFFKWWCWDFQDAPFEGVPIFTPKTYPLRNHLAAFRPDMYILAIQQLGPWGAFFWGGVSKDTSSESCPPKK